MRHYLHPGRDLVEETPRLSIEDLRAWRFIPRAGKDWDQDYPCNLSGIITLSRNGEKTGSVGVSVHVEGTWSYVKFDYLLGDEKKPVTYEHRLELFPCYYGGHRFYFRCRHCCRRVTALYLSGGYYACRHCHWLAYEVSQAHRTLSEKLHRAWSLRARADKLRKYHHPRKANRLNRRADELEAGSYEDLARWLVMKAGP
jgi:hypothetical protein